VNVISLGFRTDLMLRRMGGSVIDDRTDHRVVRTPDNPGYWWGNFVLFAAPPRAGDAERRREVFEAEFPSATHLALGVDGVDGDPGDAAERARLGVTTEVSAVLTATRLAPPLRPPADTVVRPLDGDDDWAQALALRLAVDGERPMPPGHREFAERRVAGHRALTEAGHGAWFGAFVDGRMRAGAGLFGDSDGTARFQDVETDPAYRRRGLATAVVRRLGDWGLRVRGARRLVIVADPDYHAIGIYRGLGFSGSERQVQLCRPPQPT
jgi:ribosomal protein S18 acetylase RimI-like enzyme